MVSETDLDYSIKQLSRVHVHWGHARVPEALKCMTCGDAWPCDTKILIDGIAAERKRADRADDNVEGGYTALSECGYPIPSDERLFVGIGRMYTDICAERWRADRAERRVGILTLTLRDLAYEFHGGEMHDGRQSGKSFPECRALQCLDAKEALAQTAPPAEGQEGE